MISKQSFSAQVRAELAETPAGLDDERRFVRACFIRGGTISAPSRSHHMAFSLPAEEAAQLARTLQKFGLNPKQTPQRGLSMVYVKDANEIADILNIMMAHKSLLLFENIRVEKDLRNNLNRKINFETANLNKTVSAALAHIDAIRYIEASKGLAFLPAPLEKIARLRLQFEAANLEEIGAMLSPPIGKSGVNHRLRKIYEIAKSLKGEDTID